MSSVYGPSFILIQKSRAIITVIHTMSFIPMDKSLWLITRFPSVNITQKTLLHLYSIFISENSYPVIVFPRYWKFSTALISALCIWIGVTRVVSFFSLLFPILMSNLSALYAKLKHLRRTCSLSTICASTAQLST